MATDRRRTPTPPLPSAGPGLQGTGTDPMPAGVRWATRGTVAALAAFLLAVPFALLAMAVTSESERVERLDRAVADALNDVVSDNAAATQLLVWLGNATDPWLLRLAAVLFALVLLARGRRRAALWLAITVVLAGLVGLGLKLVVQRARPAFDEPVYVASGYSFPSGHALNSMAITLAVLVVLWPVLGSWGRVTATLVGTLFVLLVGFDRIALGVHYLTDVVAGWAVGAAVVAASGAAFLSPGGMTGAPVGDVSHRSAGDVALTPDPNDGPTRVSWPTALLRMLGRLVLGWAAILVLLVAMGLQVTGGLADRWPLSAEDDLNRSLEDARTPLGEAITLVFRHFADTPVIIAAMLLAAVVLRLALGRWREALFVVASVAGQAVVFMATTILVERERPDVEQLDESPPTSSFPSGHTGAAIGLTLSLVVVVRRTVSRRWLRVLLTVLLLMLPVLVAVARLYRGMHHPSDIAGSVLNAGLCVWLAARVVLCGELPEDPPAATPAAVDHHPERRPAAVGAGQQAGDRR